VFNFDIFYDLKLCFIDFIKNKYNLEIANLNLISFDNNTEEKRFQFGDLSCNAPLIIAKVKKKSPKEISTEIVNEFKNDLIIKIDSAGIGFLNFFVNNSLYNRFLKNILTQKTFITKTIDNKEKYNIEFISANPTGPLHIGHGRGGIIGDILVRTLNKKGYTVSSEFYINDAGNQIFNLGKSLFARYKEICGEKIDFPEDGYHGEYIKEIANKIYSEFNNKKLDNNINWFGEYAQKILLEEIKNSLSNYKISFDLWFSEKTLHEPIENNKSRIDIAIEKIRKNGYIYETEDKTVWFAATKLNDDKDRVLKRADGRYTYTAADIAYLVNKINRGFTKLIMIMGQDHHSFMIRMNAIVKALGYDEKILSIILYQLVTIKNSGQLIRLSKRSGNIIELQDIIDAVGPDIARYFYLNKKNDAHLDFDLAVALQQSNSNPVYYIQYAYVRILGIIKKANDFKINIEKDFENIYKFNETEKMIIRKLSEFDKTLEIIVNSFQTHLLANYIFDLAGLFHNFYNSNICINKDDELNTKKRIALINAIFIALKESSEILGMSLPENM
jgi:arginyl-tRNA synthetase